MLARVTPVALSLLLAVTQLGISACTKVVPEPLTHTNEAAVDVRTVEPEPEEVAESGAPAMDAPAPCDGAVGVEAMVKRADAYFATRDTKGGIACLEEAVAADPQSPVARTALVKRYLAGGEGAKARVYAEELVRQQPLDAAAREMLGRAFMQQKMWQQAIDSFALVVKSEPDNIYAHNNLGFSALQVGQLELAREHLERTMSLEPQQGYMFNNLGVAYERLGRAAEAHAAFSRAAELSPKYAQAQLNRDRLQKDLSQDQRIVSAETLLRMREPAAPDNALEPTPAPAPSTDEAPSTEGGDAVQDAVDAATGVPGVPGGSARMAPAASVP